MARASGPRQLRMLTFGEPDGRWGAVWTEASGPGLLFLDGRAVAAELAEALGEWTVRAEGVELIATGVTEPVDVEPRQSGAPAARHRRCQVAVRDDGADAVELPGRSAIYELPDGVERFDSVREVSAWFWPEEAIAVFSARPRKHKGHDQDALSATVLVPEGFPPIEDPRLSTTYSAAGEPARFGLELWPDAEDQGPRRVAAEAAAAVASAESAGIAVSARPFRAHSRGQDGAGMYVLARPV